MSTYDRHTQQHRDRETFAAFFSEVEQARPAPRVQDEFAGFLAEATPGTGTAGVTAAQARRDLAAAQARLDEAEALAAAPTTHTNAEDH